MKYKLKKGLEGPDISLQPGEMMEISEAQLQGYLDNDMIEVEASTLKKVKKSIKKAEPKAEKKKAKKTKV